MDPHALLIGIDHYDPTDLCSSLRGSVADVEALEHFLLRHDVPRDRIRKLTSVRCSEERLPAESRPTYENIVAAFQRITSEAKRGEQILIHYSGHGGQTRTLIPGTKGRRGIDEGLVPCNVGDPQARYLRDVELSYLVHRMVEKGLIVTMIVDACHSGGLVRKAKLVARGSRRVDDTARPLDSLVASRKELEKSWRRIHARAYVTTRGASLDRRSASGWFAPTRGAVLLAACRSFESAYEYPFDGEFRGLLTYCLLEILAEGGNGLSFQVIHNRLIGRVYRHTPHQTPVLEGDVNRRLLGGRLRSLLQGINVMEVDGARHRVLLNAGQALGLRKGALLQVLPEKVGTHFHGPIVEIEECGAFTSWGAVQAAGARMPELRLGDQAVLIDPGNRLRRHVALARPLREVPRLLEAMRQELSNRPGGFLELVEDAGHADYQVTVNSHGEIEICYGDGQSVADLPPLPTTACGAPEQVVERLAHLVKFHNVYGLENNDPTSPLHRQLEVEIGLLAQDFRPGDELEPRPFTGAGSIPQVKTGRWICLTITNNSPQQLQIYVLDLQPGWSIEQIHPLSGLETLDGEQQIRLPFGIYLPGGFENNREILKVFATADPADFRWLELAPIDHPPKLARSSLGAPGDPLEQFFVEIATDGPRARHVRAHPASRQWASVQVEFEVLP